MTETSTDDVLGHPSVQRVIAALSAFGSRGQVVALESAARTAKQAAAALGVEEAQIANSLVFRAHDQDGATTPLLILASGAHRVDLPKVADLLTLAEISRADPAFVLRHTGFAIGGVAPIGHTSRISTVVDVSLSRHEQVWAAAGHPHTVFPTTYDELLRMTGGHAAEVA